MKKLNNVKWFTLGVVVCILISSLVVSATAASRQRQATLNYSDIKITLNGNPVIPRDGSGNAVEPFTIDGTTYLPLRGIANVLGLDVGWDGTTNTVILSGGAATGGTQPSQPAPQTPQPTPTPSPSPSPTPTPSPSPSPSPTPSPAPPPASGNQQDNRFTNNTPVYNTNDIGFNPKEVWYEDGNLYVEMFVTNGRNSTIHSIDVNSLSISNRNSLIAQDQFGRMQNASIAPNSYIVWTFIFPSASVRVQDADLTQNLITQSLHSYRW